MCRREENASLRRIRHYVSINQVRAAQMAVYELLRIDRKIPPVTPHDKSLQTQFEALIKAFK